MIKPSQVLELKARGLTQQAVALKLGCSERTVRTHWKPTTETLTTFSETLTTKLLGFEGIADDVVAGPSSEWLAWDGELRPVVPGMTGAAWKREQRALHRQHLAKRTEPAELPLLAPAVKPEVATGNRQFELELPVVAATDLLYAPRVTMSSAYEARLRSVNRFATPSPVHVQDLSYTEPFNLRLWGIVALTVFFCIVLFATTHYHVVAPLRGSFAPSVSVRMR